MAGEEPPFVIERSFLRNKSIFLEYVMSCLKGTYGKVTSLVVCLAYAAASCVVILS